MKKISSIAAVSFGVNTPPDKFGDVTVIQSRSIDEAGVYNSFYNSTVLSTNLSEKDYLKTGDLLFQAKGTTNRPYVVQKKNLPAAASSVFFVIRINRKIIFPEYLAWYLKTPRVEHWMHTISEGSTISSISIKEFRKFRIPVPDLEVQKKIMELQELQAKYKKYVELLTTKTELLNNEISKRLIGEKDE